MKKYQIYLCIILFLVTAFVVMCFIPISASKLIPDIEKQISNDLGVSVHIDKLILRIGPLLKVKSPVMHVMYEDGQKFAQFDNIKFYIPWGAIIRKKPVVKSLYANKLIVNVNSDDKFLIPFVNKIQSKSYEESPNISIKEYDLTYTDKITSDKYNFKGKTLNVSKIYAYENWKICTAGCFNINDKRYFSYDISILPQLKFKKVNDFKQLAAIVHQIKTIGIQADIILDLKLYQDKDQRTLSSGFVNIDNIRLLSDATNIPKSFIYLTMLGNKASILSNVSVANNDKLFIEGQFDNSKTPIVDIKVKTSNISLADLHKKLKIFTSFSKYSKINSISGTLSANCNIKGDLKKIKSNGFIKIKNASIDAGGINIDKIDSDIDFTGNKININNAIGYVKKAPLLLKGCIDNKNLDVELLMDKVALKYLFPAKYGISDGIGSLSAHFTGKPDNIIHKEIVQIKNLKIKNNTHEVIVNSLEIDTNKDNVAYAKGMLINILPMEKIKIPSVKFIIEPDYIKIPETNIFLPNSKLVMKSEILNYNKQNLSFSSAFEGFVNPKDFHFYNNFSAQTPLKIQFYGNKNAQNIIGQLAIADKTYFGEPVIINLNSKLEKNILKIDDLSMYQGFLDANQEFKFNKKGNKKIFINGEVDLLKQPILRNVRIFIPQALNIKLSDTCMQLRGDLFANGDVKKPELIGQIIVHNFADSLTKLSLQNAVFEFNKNIVNLNVQLVKFTDSSLSLSAIIDTDLSKKLNIRSMNIKSKYLNTKELLTYKKNVSLTDFPISISEGKFYAEKLDSALYDSLVPFTAFSADFKVENNDLYLRNITSEIYNGKLSGAIDFNIKEQKYISNILCRGVSSASVFKVISNRKENISGSMDFDATLKGNLSNKNSLLGNVKFVIHNGRMASLGRLEHLLYAQNVVADSMLRTSLSAVTKVISLKDTGLFKYLRGEMVVNNNIADIKMLQSQGPSMSLFVKGTYNIADDYAKLTILGRLSDDVVSGLGAFGEFSFNKLMIMLTGEENNYNNFIEDLSKLPLLSAKNTKEFRSIINGPIDKTNSVILFNWISYSKKSLKQKEIPMTNIKLPAFLEDLPY